MRKKSGKSTTILLVLLLLVGLSVMLYPTISDWWNSKTQSRAVATYQKAANDLSDKENEEILSRARKYNEEIAKLARPFVDYDQVKGYEDILDITGTGVMGYISIPTIRVELPIYHGTSDGVLNVAVGHLQGSSLPVGGADTHSVISAHRGLPSAKLFSDLDKLAEGDEFTITVLKEVYTYEVEAVYIVLPNEMDKLNIIPGEDHVTLTTCTPYGVNSHRLLVRAKRVETADDTKSVSKITADAVQLDSLVVVPFVAIPLFVVLLVWWFVDSKRKKISHDELVAMLDKPESDDNVENLPDKCHKQRTAERLGFAIAHKRWWQRLGSDLVHLHMERLQQSDCKTCLFINTSKTHRVLHPVRFIFLRQVLFFLYQKFLVCHRICSVVLTFLGGDVYSQWLLQGCLFEKLDLPTR